MIKSDTILGMFNSYGQDKTTKMKLFYSYSHFDSDLRETLETHLSILKRQNIISTWSDRNINAGQDWKKKIDENLVQSDIVLLLISSYFIASDYCYENEMEYAIREHNNGNKLVIPIFIRPCLWEDAPFSKIQGLPIDAKAVTTFPDVHLAFTNIVKGIKKSIQEFKPDISSSKISKNTQILDIEKTSAYLKKTHQSYSSFFKDKTYIELKAINSKSNHSIQLDNELLDWAINKEYPLFLVGDFGSGKTWALKKLIHNISSNISLKITPIFISIPTIVNIAQQVKVGFDNIEGYNSFKSDSDFVKLFVLDGLDELAFNKAYNISEVVSKIFEKLPKYSKVIISCRRQTYNRLGDLDEISFSSKKTENDDNTEWAIDKAICKPQFLCIKNLDENDIENYFRNSEISEVWKYYENKSQIYELTKQPVLLRLFERLLEEYKIDVKINTFYSFYEKALFVWLYRDKNLNIVTNTEVYSWLLLCEEIFFQMFPKNYSLLTNKITTDSREKINGLLHVDILSLSAKNLITFSHQSLYEYFYSRRLLRELSNFESKLLARSNLIYIYQVNRFIVPELIALSINKHVQSLNNQITDFIIEDEYNQFVNEANWRKSIGYGQWMHFSSPDGTPPSSDEDRIYSFDTKPKVKTDNVSKIVSGISWYDAIQYCRWKNIRLLTLREAIEHKPINNELLEWTSDWYDEKKSQIAVVQGGKVIGLNPDLRDKFLSFRTVK